MSLAETRVPTRPARPLAAETAQGVLMGKISRRNIMVSVIALLILLAACGRSQPGASSTLRLGCTLGYTLGPNNDFTAADAEVWWTYQYNYVGGPVYTATFRGTVAEMQTKFNSIEVDDGNWFGPFGTQAQAQAVSQSGAVGSDSFQPNAAVQVRAKNPNYQSVAAQDVEVSIYDQHGDELGKSTVPLSVLTIASGSTITAHAGYASAGINSAQLWDTGTTCKPSSYQS